MTNEKETFCIFGNNDKRMADWSDRNVAETVAEIITKRFAKYIKDQEDLEKIGKTEEDYFAPPNGLNQ